MRVTIPNAGVRDIWLYLIDSEWFRSLSEGVGMNRQEKGNATNTVVIIAAVIGALGAIAAAVVPGLLNDKDDSSGNEEPAVVIQESEDVIQKNEKGHNFNNVAGNITITESVDKEE